MSSSDVKTWNHARKGRITGRIVADHDDFVTIRLVGDHHLSMASISGRINDADPEDGEEIQVRKSLLTEVG